MRVKVGPRQGFSIIELLTVIMIIGILSAITIPLGINYVRSYQVMAAAQAVSSQMQYARAQAVRRNSRNGILLNLNYPATGDAQFTTLDEDPQNGGYANPIYPGQPGDWKAPALSPPGNNVSPPHGPVVSLPLTYAFVANGTTNSLRFLSNGTVEAVPSIADGRPNVISIDPTGREFTVQVTTTLTGLSRVIRITTNGRVTIEPAPPES